MKSLEVSLPRLDEAVVISKLNACSGRLRFERLLTSDLYSSGQFEIEAMIN